MNTNTFPAPDSHLANSGIDRDELFVTTKLWNADHGFDTSLSKLGLDIVETRLGRAPYRHDRQDSRSWQPESHGRPAAR